MQFLSTFNVVILVFHQEKVEKLLNQTIAFRDTFYE